LLPAPCGVSLVLGQLLDATAIAIIVVINAAIRFFQEPPAASGANWRTA